MSYTVKQGLSIRWDRAVMFKIMDLIKDLEKSKKHNWLIDYDLSISKAPGMMDVYLETRRGIPVKDICKIFRITGSNGSYGNGCSYSDGDCHCMKIHFKDGEIIQIQEGLVSWDDTDMNDIKAVTSIDKIYSESEIEEFKKEHNVEVSPRLSVDELPW